MYMPCKLRPCYKEYLWGGQRLKKDFHKTDAPAVTAESWELAQHPDGLSVVAEGEYAGRTLGELGALDHDAFWGRKCPAERFPLLVKLIDADKDLSIQVHPSDESADPALGEEGKAELWYVVDCEPGGALYLGFSQPIGRAEFERRAADGSICQVLNRVNIARGDVFYVKPGTIHAICRGTLIAEIQQNSNTTFRVFDYQRLGADGKPRALHLERAAGVVSYQPIIPQECRANNSLQCKDFTLREMFSCAYFKTYCLDVRASVGLFCDGDSFQHLLCVEGDGFIRCEGRIYPFARGESFFLPAAMGEYKIFGTCRILISRL